MLRKGVRLRSGVPAAGIPETSESPCTFLPEKYGSWESRMIFTTGAGGKAVSFHGKNAAFVLRLCNFTRRFRL